MKTEKIFETARLSMRKKGYSKRTQDLYIRWMKEYMLYHGNINPTYMGIREIELFKNYLTKVKRASLELKTQATQAIFFLYTQILKIDLQNEYINSARNMSQQKSKIVQSVMVF